MIILNNRLAKLPLSARLNDLFNFFKDNGSFDSMETCSPGCIGFKRDYEEENINLISPSECFGCLCCLEENDANAFSFSGVPIMSSDEEDTFTHVAKTLFKGRYVNVGPNPNKFHAHSSLNEKAHTTPIAANLFLFLSSSYNDIAIRSSPNWELSIDTTDPRDPREGHLDLVVANGKKKRLVVGEVKSSITSFLRDTRRDQWKRYNDAIHNEAKNNGYEALFLYIIGGEEVPCYPKGATDCPSPATDRREEFYDFILKENKRFISLESLRSLKLLKLVNNNITWEKHLFSLLSENVCGLLSGGVVNRELNLLPCNLE